MVGVGEGEGAPLQIGQSHVGGGYFGLVGCEKHHHQQENKRLHVFYMEKLYAETVQLNKFNNDRTLEHNNYQAHELSQRLLPGRNPIATQEWLRGSDSG